MQKNNEKYYSGESGEVYARHIGQETVFHIGHVLQSKAYLPYLTENMDVLDFGCGNGALAKVISQSVRSIEGLEVNDFPRNLAEKENNLKVYKSIQDLSVSGKKFDAIISNHVLEHVPNPIETLKQLREFLRADGVFVTMLPIDDYRSSENKRWQPGNLDRHLHTWTPLLIGNTFEDSGYIPTTIKIVKSAWSERFFFLGVGFFQTVVSRLLSTYLKRKQLFVVAQLSRK
jgi:2-polyprenyl-3-methyl-5-hydroxy-6-metoxy-1,4-benzoquinol methylase